MVEAAGVVPRTATEGGCSKPKRLPANTTFEKRRLVEAAGVERELSSRGN